MDSRGLSKQEAADYCGCRTLAAFDDWKRKGIIPGPIPGTCIYDRKVLDAALDRASGLSALSEELSPYQKAKAENANKVKAS